MVDIFLSYSRDDLPTARRFAQGFEREGLSVWWDQTLNPGEAFDEVTEKALNEAKAVVVLWSKNSVASRWVRAEATQANDNKTLVPVMIEPCKRPIMFELTHTADLSNWKGNPDDAVWQSYLAGVKRVAGKEGAGARTTAMPVQASRSPRQFDMRMLLGLGAIVVVAAGAFWAINRQGNAHTTTPASSTAAATAALAPARGAGKPRIAIMPFENLSPDPANAFFTDGMHEEILTALANGAPDLEVISRTTMMTYRAATKPVAEIAKELNATYVLEGSVRRDGQDVRLTLQLIDARSDGHIWAQNFDRKLFKAMTLQLEVAGEVANQLSVKLASAARIAVPPTNDPQAYDLYLKAHLELQLLNASAPDIAAWRKTEALLTQAIARDPSFALAYAERADLRFSVFISNLDTSEQQRAAARADLDAAERLRPNDPAWLPREAAWKWLDHDYARALALLSAAEAAGIPELATLFTRQDILGRMGLYADALPLLDRAVALDPANSFLLGTRGIVLVYLHRPAEAIKAYQQAADRVPAYAPLAKTLQAYIRFGFTGDLKALESIGGGGGPVGVQSTAELRKGRKFGAALPERQPEVFIGLLRPVAVGDTPQRALLLGDIDLQLGDREAAARDGRAVLAFVAGEKVTAYNEWFLKVLTARGKLYLGDHPGALAAAHEALVLTPRSLDATHWAISSRMTVDVLARCGAADEAVTTLEQLVVAVPGLMPAEIARPEFAVPLANNARFKALSAKLDAQMAATKLE